MPRVARRRRGSMMSLSTTRVAIAVALGLAHAHACAVPAAAEHLRVVDSFYGGAKALRSTFDDHFAEPRQAHPQRFVWDYWHVPGQYTLHRTQAANYFEPDAFDALTDALTSYGKNELGLRAISPPWLSFYVDGCEQAVHADVPQGPLAYVLSLTNWDERAFIGGETTILQPPVLDYWRDFDSSTGLEYDDLFTTVPPLFNRLTVFDARLPHGVRRVEGERDPRGARLVLHGWFTEAEPFFDGGLKESDLEAGADPVEARAGVAKRIIAALTEAKFEPCEEATQITIPFTFD